MEILRRRTSPLLLIRRIIPQASNHEITRSALDLAHNVFGKLPSPSPPVIIIHGLLGSKRIWQNMAQSIAKSTKKSVIALDVRNHGDSPYVSTHTYPELAADVVQLMSKKSIETAHVIGHSMGGRIAMTLALTESAKVKSLVVVDVSPMSSPKIIHEFFPKIFGVMNSVKFEGVKNKEAARKTAKEAFKKAGILAEGMGLHFMMSNIDKRPDKTLGWRYNVEVLSSNLKDIAKFPSNLMDKQYKGPVLFIGGGKSPFIPKSDLPGMKKLFPAADLKYVPNAGHNVYAEKPRLFHKLVVEFLKK